MSIFDWWTTRKLESDDPEKRKKAIEALVTSGTYEPLISVLKNPARRDEAISEISKMREGAEDFLKAAVNHPASEVKAAATLAFAKMGNARAADLLAALVKDRTAAVQDRVDAVRLLSEASKAPATTATLEATLNDPDQHLRTEAALALGRLVEPSAAQPLIDVVSDPQVNLKARSEAASLLGKLGDGRAIEPLKSLLEENNQLQTAALNALGMLGVLDPLIRRLPAQDVDAAKALGESRANRAVGPLIEALNHGDATWHGHVIRALGEIGDVQALDGVYNALSLHTGTDWKLLVAQSMRSDNRPIEIIREMIRDEERTAYGYAGRDWAASAKKSLVPLVEALGRTGNALAQEPIGNLISKERKALEELMKANDFIHHYESLELLTSAATALGKVGNANDFPTLNLLSHQLEIYRQSILHSGGDHAWTDARRFEEVKEAAEKAIRTIEVRQARRTAAVAPAATVKVVDDGRPRLSIVIFREGMDQPSRPDDYYQAIVSKKFGASNPVITQWRILGLDAQYLMSDCGVLYKKMVVEGKLDYFGVQVDEWEGKGPDGRRVVALFYSMDKAAELFAAEKSTQKAPVKSIEVNIESLRAICVGFVDLQPRQDDAFQLGLDLMERWNAKLYEAFKQDQPDAKMRVFGAPSIDRLVTNLTDLAKDEYPDCLAVLQTGGFDTYQRSTQTHAKVEVVLATFWKTDAAPACVVAAGMDLTLLPAEDVTRDEGRAFIDPKILWQQAVNVSGEISEIKLDRLRREETMRWWVGAVAAMPTLVFAGLEYSPSEAKGRTWSMLGKTVYFLLNPEDSTMCRPCKESYVCWEAALKCEGTSSYWKHSLMETAGLDEVRAHLDSDDPVLQMCARLKMAEHDEDAGYLIELLKTGDYQMQEAAAAALGRVGDPAAVTALEAALQSGSGNITRAALEALTNIGDPAVSALLHYLQEENPWRRKSAALALGKVGNARALGPLKEALKVSVPAEVEAAFRSAIDQIQRKLGR
jgi:HEAT repeat protein